MSSHSLPKSQAAPDENSQPPELHSANKDSNSTPDPDVILIDNDAATDSKAVNGGSGRERSEVWKHFHKKTIDGAVKAICNYCNKSMKADSGAGTMHLKNHYTKKHKQRPAESIRQKLLASNFSKEHPEMAAYSFNHEAVKQELAKMIVMHEYPLSIVDQIGFKRYSAQLQPLFKVPSRNTIKNEIFQIYEYEKARTSSLLESITSRVAITTDLWTASNQKKGYMAVTAHFIDEAWLLQSRIMRFIYVPCPHTKEALSEHLLKCLLDWNMDTKISCLTVDNCTTNDAMIEIILDKLDNSSLIAGGSLFHMRCAAHILNLIVKDGLEVIKAGVEKIRDSVAYWTATPKREEKFEETARQLRIPCTKKLGLDYLTRWNSTYLMLERALIYKDVFARLGQREAQYKTLPSREEWDFAQNVCERLKAFYVATEVFSGTKYPTANLCFINICEIHLAITEWRRSDNFVIQTMAEKMLIKFEKYWHVMHGVIGVAAVLDPRYKLEVLEFYFEKIFGVNAAYKVDAVRDLCYTLLKEYHDRGVANKEGNGDSNDTSCVSNSENKSQYDLFISKKKRKRVDTIKSELDLYLDEDVLPKIEGFDILTWWKANAPKYPNLQRMAQDFLAIPASTVASESTFSSSGRLVSPHRNRLHPNTIEALMCAQSWLWAAEMKGEPSLGYATIYNDTESEDSCVTRQL